MVSKTYDDYYKILQVDPAAEPEVIAAAYRRLAIKYHPDTNKSPDAIARMQKINEAWEVLSSPVGRTAYDRTRQGYGARDVARPQYAPASYTAANNDALRDAELERNRAVRSAEESFKQALRNADQERDRVLHEAEVEWTKAKRVTEENWKRAKRDAEIEHDRTVKEADEKWNRARRMASTSLRRTT